MRKCLCLFLLMTVLLCSCGGTGNNASAAPATADVSIHQLENLFEENLHCVEDLLVLGALPYDSEAVLHDHIYPVRSVEYRSYADLEAYLKTVYTAAETARLLDEDGEPLYLEVHGVLCIDTYRIGGREYNVNWQDFEIAIDSVDDKGCYFTVTGSQPTADNAKETRPYTVTGCAVYEDDRLVLEKILY